MGFFHSCLLFLRPVTFVFRLIFPFNSYPIQFKHISNKTSIYAKHISANNNRFWLSWYLDKCFISKMFLFWHWAFYLLKCSLFHYVFLKTVLYQQHHLFSQYKTTCCLLWYLEVLFVYSDINDWNDVQYMIQNNNTNV